MGGAKSRKNKKRQFLHNVALTEMRHLFWDYACMRLVYKHLIQVQVCLLCDARGSGQFTSLAKVNINSGKRVYCGFPHVSCCCVQVEAVITMLIWSLSGAGHCALQSSHQIRGPADVCAASYVCPNAAGHYSGYFCGQRGAHAHSPQPQREATLGSLMVDLSGTLVFALTTGQWREDVRNQRWLIH